jgi:hypothetical protein
MRAIATLLGTALAASALLSTQEASAQLIIRNPSDHPDYRVELEPHGTLVPFGDAYGYGYRPNHFYRGYAFTAGVGFRATIEIVDPVIPKLNNTIGITFGLDLTNCAYCYYGEEFSFWFPIGAQWNFFLTKKWSVFGEVGFAPHSDGAFRDVFFEPMIEVGGRYHFREKISLLVRVGVPFVNVGVGFML